MNQMLRVLNNQDANMSIDNADNKCAIHLVFLPKVPEISSLKRIRVSSSKKPKKHIPQVTS